MFGQIIFGFAFFPTYSDSNSNTSFSFLFFFHFLPVVWGHAWAEHYSSHDGAKLSGSRTLGMTPEATHSLSLKRRNVISLSLCGWGRAAQFKRFNISWDCFFLGGGVSLADWNFWTAALRELVDVFLILSNKKKNSFKNMNECWSSQTEATVKCTRIQFVGTRPADLKDQLQSSPRHTDAAPPLVTASQYRPI